MDRESIAIKIRTEAGCFCPSHSPEVHQIIEEWNFVSRESREFTIYEHESGPEIIALLALGTAGLAVAKSVVDLIISIVNACRRGKEKGDNIKGKLLLIVRDTYRTKDSEEEIVLEIYDKDTVTNEVVRKAIDKGIKRNYEKHRNGR